MSRPESDPDIRLSAAEVYGVLRGFPEVLHCIARVATFGVLEAIRKQLSARHVPSLILKVAEAPCTLDKKSTEHVASDVKDLAQQAVDGGFNNPDGAHVFGERKPVPTFEEIMATKSIQTHVQKSLLDYGNMRKPVLYIDGVLSKQQPLVVK
ncbi:hypothetical protein MGG_14828 [Pyricularia oryzae 70-15]|uniref:Uncharacterized protein n=1 Tax=Pyricularia oryzae (strain 70-15 / ATCC MYA-4617 / FGSC 8958) TaxID=242507 RepID=G4N9C7_PYRO7|nr:uncharacterized protein MGG_14828 [Pyricularia oryzae 70-15]EHA51168.1 hypothetical protein MGG_14828 [Pyricularia oryzae 70-15]KAI7917606.1 hypothetical protein M9X92_007350 [Pyricularia oryzae]KAI7918588.1 hypothetical protein M0657_007532 [Pyricularia oryzae]